MRDIFVGIICSISIFLFCYNGYEKQDRIASFWAGISAAGVALFPTSDLIQDEGLVSYIHYGCAISFFAALIYFSLFLFTKTSSTKEPTDNKLNRNLVFKCCGYVMFTCVIFILVYSFGLKTKFPEWENWKPIFWLESIALWAFGISWAVKGELILKDYQDSKDQTKQNIFNITLVVEDYYHAIKFYTEKLKFKLLEDTNLGDGKRWVRLVPNGSLNPSILLAKAVTMEEKARIGNQTGNRVFLFLNTDDIQRDYDNLVQNSVKIVREPKLEAYGTVLVFSDLYGNLWDLIEPIKA
jgi:predicted enzyme related to lactoylglutathione lyase